MPGRISPGQARVAPDDFQGRLEFRETAGQANEIANAGHGAQSGLQSAAVLDEVLEIADGYDGFNQVLGLVRGRGDFRLLHGDCFLAILVDPEIEMGGV